MRPAKADHPDRPDWADLDHWRSFFPLTTLSARRAFTLRWAEAAGGMATATGIALPADLPQRLALAQIRVWARMVGFTVLEVARCVRCGDPAEARSALCAVCGWLAGAGAG